MARVWLRFGGSPVGLAGFEPAAPCSQSRCHSKGGALKPIAKPAASQAETSHQLAMFSQDRENGGIAPETTKGAPTITVGAPLS